MTLSFPIWHLVSQQLHLKFQEIKVFSKEKENLQSLPYCTEHRSEGRDQLARAMMYWRVSEVLADGKGK